MKEIGLSSQNIIIFSCTPTCNIVDRRKSFQYFTSATRVGVIEVSQSHFMYNSNESTKHDFIVLCFRYLHFNTFDGPFTFSGSIHKLFIFSFFMIQNLDKENTRVNTLNNEEVAISTQQ